MISPKHRQVSGLILAEVLRQGCRDNDRIPSRPYWRRHLGVANDTIDRALKDLVRDGILASRPGSGTFLASRAAADRRLGRRLSLTVIVPRSREQMLSGDSAPVYLRRLEGISRGCAAGNVLMSLRFVDPYAYNSSEALLNAIGVVGDGVLIFQEPMAARLEEPLRERGIPFLVLGATPRTRNAVQVDLRPAYTEVFEHLKRIGRTRIAYLGDDPASVSSPHAELAAIQASCGVRFEKSFWTDPARPDELARIVEEQIAGTGIDAILARTDTRALPAMAALQRRGIRVPEDMVVIGFDDAEESAAASPPLASVRNPLEDAGAAAVMKLADMARDRQLECEPLRVPASFILRASAQPGAAIPST